VVEHSLGKGEVESSILSCSTIHPFEKYQYPEVRQIATTLSGVYAVQSERFQLISSRH
jgi:hypothetical protein